MGKKEIRPKASKFKLKVKRSYAGLGLFAEQEIPKGEQIIQYGGYKITNEEAEEKGGKYLFEIDKSKYTIDGTPRWNTARYVNHSCKPNCEAVWYDEDLWICSKRKILPGEELSYNYGKEYFEGIIGGKDKCLCQSCRAGRDDKLK